MLSRSFNVLPFLFATKQPQFRPILNLDQVPQAAPLDTTTTIHSSGLITSTIEEHSNIAESVQVTRLQNGVRIISQDLGGAIASIGAYTFAGPAFEPANCPGLGAMLQSAFTLQNSKQTTLNGKKIVNIEEFYPKVHKYHVSAHVNCSRDGWQSRKSSHRIAEEQAKMKSKSSSKKQNSIFGIITASLTNPPIQKAEVETLHNSSDTRLNELRWKQPTEYAKLLLETVAYYLEPLGSPRFVPVENSPYITSAVLQEHHSLYAVSSRTIIAGVNVDHDALVEEYENASIPDSNPPSEPPNTLESEEEVNLKTETRQYTGGERHDHEDRAKVIITKPFMDTETICAVGWLTYGQDRVQLKQYAASLVAKALLDLGLTNDRHHNTGDSCVGSGMNAFYTPFQTAGLLGFTLVSEPAQAPKMLLEAMKLVKGIKNAPQEAVNIAKLNARVSFLNENTVSIQDYCDFLCTCLPPISDSRMVTGLDEVLLAIESVSTTDIKCVIDMMLSHPTSFYGHGEMHRFPSIRHLGL
ncbi:unnamed protein product [Phytomonas sp. Hart1]|nr:unnamed protein product [Phytomonas sp. Hart1]|eukprot:CCW66803.1 unnamed protein product [Phytomonas sp. isolate Hart1]